MIDYSPLWATMQRQGISQYQLLKSGIDNKTLDSLKKNKNITMLTLQRLCAIIGCTPNDIVRFSQGEKPLTGSPAVTGLLTARALWGHRAGLRAAPVFMGIISP